jgi:acylphosphatase
MRLRVRIKGEVQGVGFRYWLRAQANQLGLAGWVRNSPYRLGRAEDEVEAEFAGEKEAIEKILELCQQGPPLARVSGLEKKILKEPWQGGKEFVILR